jgi:NAD-dependent deacetylase sirtuin 7
MLKKGLKIETPDFATVKPTYTHMILNELLNKNMIKHIISQNCDGLHLRSGINDRKKLSELHGNCFIEHCLNCNQEYIRLFDVTQNSRFRKHNTGRLCTICQTTELNDSIIHFGEKLKPFLPYNLELAEEAVGNADTILCIGSSLKVLKHYKWLWPSDKNGNKKNLYIINIQWTPKDKFANLKINGYCDQVLEKVVYFLNKDFNLVIDYNEYVKSNDPLLNIAKLLTDPVEIKNLEEKKMVNDNDDRAVASCSTKNSWYNQSFKKI